VTSIGWHISPGPPRFSPSRRDRWAREATVATRTARRQRGGGPRRLPPRNAPKAAHFHRRIKSAKTVIETAKLCNTWSKENGGILDSPVDDVLNAWAYAPDAPSGGQPQVSDSAQEPMVYPEPKPMVEPLVPHSSSEPSPQPTSADPLYALLRARREPADRRVMTPGGPGHLCQVFTERAGVVLDSTRRVAFFHPSEIRVAGSISGPTA
jgi:hypothetical protein